jgi:shikimate kinase
VIGVGRSGGAGTIVNAMATGRGVTFGLAFHVEVRVRPAARWSVRTDARVLGAREARLAVESARLVSPAPLTIEVRSDIPAERGLKSSSAVSVATIRAAVASHGRRWSDTRILESAAAAGLRSGTSVTGAYDDAAACLLGGVCFTDNRRRRLVRHDRLPAGLVAVVKVPARRLQTRKVRGTDFEPIRALVSDAERLALSGDLRSAMLLNTAAYGPLFAHRTSFSTQALAAGAWAAGLSGKGPAEIALVRRPDLARVRRLWPGARVVAVRNGRVA